MVLHLCRNSIHIYRPPIPNLKASFKSLHISTAIRSVLMFLVSLAFSSLAVACWIICRIFFKRSALDNIPGPPSISWKGVFTDVFNPNAWDFHRDMAEKFGSVIKIRALFGENQLYVFDPKALHYIVVKEQHLYEETSAFIEGNKLMFGDGLLGTLGEQHRKQRKMLNPVFSVAHMRDMVPIFYKVTHQLRNAIALRVKDGPQEIDLLRWMTRTALELISQSGLGCSFDSLTEDEAPHPYTASAKRLLPLAFKMVFPRTYILSTLVKIGTPKFRRAVVNLLPWKTAHQLRDTIDVLHLTSLQILASKKQALREGNEAISQQIGEGKDILSILLRANMDASEADRLSDEEVLGQMSTLMFAAMDTTSSALSRILHLLSIFPDVQDKLRREITEARREQGEDLTYDQLVSLPYLDAVCRETLRLYAPISNAVRTTRQNVVLPLSKPIKGLDGQEMTEIPIPNNTNIIVAIMSCNRNPELWGPDSYEWKPERWLQPLPETVTSAHLPGVYSNLMTFLGGGRACIGFKFSQLEMKVVLSLLVETFQFSLPEKTIVWQMNTVATPTTSHVNNTNYQLPLMVSMAT